MKLRVTCCGDTIEFVSHVQLPYILLRGRRLTGPRWLRRSTKNI